LVSPGTEVWFNVEVDETIQVFLRYRQGLSEPFTEVEMYDDGNHQDGNAGDGIYGISLMAGSSTIEYYIYTENDDASSFSPEHAEYEFYTIPVSGDLVINEFMADNENTVADQDGEYDDWIEFYNNGTEAISLEGYYLSDDASNLKQWTFPDTTIAPKSYMIVWADNDEEQAGLHANFKLSKSGEMILLSDTGQNVLDDVSYGQQYADTTTGRFPNGTGDYEMMAPTFGMENISWPTNVEDVKDGNLFGLRAYPNPVTDKLNISFILQSPAEISISLYNVYGQSAQLVSSKGYSAGNQHLEIGTSNLSDGMWICSLVIDGTIHTIKLLKI